MYGDVNAGLDDISMYPEYTPQPLAKLFPPRGTSNASSTANSQPTKHLIQDNGNINVRNSELPTSMGHSNMLPVGQSEASGYQQLPTTSTATDWATQRAVDYGPGSWSFPDSGSVVDPLPDFDMDFVDVNVDLDDGVNWYSWIEFAKGMESGATQSSL